MQLPLFQLKLKTIPLPRRRDHFVFMRLLMFPKKVPYVITVSQISR